MAKRGNGEGSISRRKGGGWTAQYYVDTGGVRKRKTLYAKSQAEAARALSKAISDRDGGLVYDVGKLTIGEYLKLWLADSVKDVLKETTYANQLEERIGVSGVWRDQDLVVPERARLSL